MLEELRVGFLVTSTSVALITCEGSNGEGWPRSKHSCRFLQVLLGTPRACARDAPWAQRRFAECGRAPQLWGRPGSAPKAQLPSNRPGSCEHRRPRFSPAGSLGEGWTWSSFSFWVQCGKQKGHTGPRGLRVRVRFRRCPGREVSRPMSHPHAGLRTVGSSGARGASHACL